MFHKVEVEQQVAEFLLQIKAIKLQPEKPFSWASGLKSPIYCDNRLTLSHPAIRTYIRQQLVAMIQEEFGAVSCIAGVATAGIPQGVLVAQELGMPFLYVRSKPKEHGTGNLVEGELHRGQRIVVVEDLISTGKSSLQAVEALRQAGGDVAGLAAIFTYGLDEAVANFKNARCRFATLSNYAAVIKYAAEKQYITDNQISILQQWRTSPAEWSKKFLAER